MFAWCNPKRTPSLGWIVMSESLKLTRILLYQPCGMAVGFDWLVQRSELRRDGASFNACADVEVMVQCWERDLWCLCDCTVIALWLSRTSRPSNQQKKLWLVINNYNKLQWLQAHFNSRGYCSNVQSWLAIISSRGYLEDTAFHHAIALFWVRQCQDSGQKFEPQEVSDPVIPESDPGDFRGNDMTINSNLTTSAMPCARKPYPQPRKCTPCVPFPPMVDICGTMYRLQGFLQ